MPPGKVKKAKKPQWELTLGMKQVIIGALGVTWMMMIIFILGVLAGRGDIYRWLSNWGLITPVSSKMAQWSPPGAVPPPATPTKKSPSSGVAAAPGSPTPKKVSGSIVPVHPPAHAHSSRAKRSKKGFSRREQKARDEEMRRLRREVVSKLKFQNSFDSKPSKSAHATLKRRDKAGAFGQKTQSRQVRVAQYRNLKRARAKMAELQKKGEKVALKKGKDHKGVYYEVFREASAIHPRRGVGLAQKTQKSNGKKSKKHTGRRN